VNNGKLSYAYSFNCKDVIDNFDILPVEMQGNIEYYIASVICDSFIEPADEDYVTARFLAQKGMYRAFFWAASQALEKYLKAFLLMRGTSVNRNCFRGHPIAALYAEASLVDSNILSIDTKPHPSINIRKNASELVAPLSLNEFISDIELQGSPDNRYNSSGVNFNTGYLFALDSFVFGLRNMIGVPPIQESIRKMDQSLTDWFNLYNPWFESASQDLAEIPNEDFDLVMAGSTTTLDFLIGPRPPRCAEHVLHWLNKKMKLPGTVKQHLKVP
jgi:hypothetical protein